MQLDKSQADPLTTGQVAELFGVSTEAVRQWADGDKIPSFRTPGGQRRFHRADIELLLSTEAAS